MSAVWKRDTARDVLRRNRAMSRNAGASEDALLDALEACVTPSPAHTIDRDALAAEIGRLRSNELMRRHIIPVFTDQEWADRILALLRPAPAHTIDRDALERLLYDYADVCGTGEDDPTPGVTSEILALLRPVEGVVLTREEAARVASWLEVSLAREDPACRALTVRLEGS